jgi:hypothetical protein
LERHARADSVRGHAADLEHFFDVHVQVLSTSQTGYSRDNPSDYIAPLSVGRRITGAVYIVTNEHGCAFLGPWIDGEEGMDVLAAGTSTVFTIQP